MSCGPCYGFAVLTAFSQLLFIHSCVKVVFCLCSISMSISEERCSVSVSLCEARCSVSLSVCEERCSVSLSLCEVGRVFCICVCM
jgi:hypothetical protein